MHKYSLRGEKVQDVKKSCYVFIKRHLQLLLYRRTKTFLQAQE